MSYRRHTRVRRRSRYAEWMTDAFNLHHHWAMDIPSGATSVEDRISGAAPMSLSGTLQAQYGSVVGGVAGSLKGDGSTGQGVVSDTDVADLSSSSFTVLWWTVPRRGNIEGLGPVPVVNKRASTPITIQTVIRDDSSFDRSLIVAARDANSNLAITRPEQVWSYSEPLLGGMVMDRSDDTIYAITDGKRVGSDQNTSLGDISTSDDLTSYDDADVGATAMGDELQHVSVFDSALSESETTAIYEQGAEFFDRGRLL